MKLGRSSRFAVLALLVFAVAAVGSRLRRGRNRHIGGRHHHVTAAHDHHDAAAHDDHNPGPCDHHHDTAAYDNDDIGGQHVE